MVIQRSAMENLVMHTSFWNGKKVFITGHTGFKGSWLSLWLQKLNAKVIGYALKPPTLPNLFSEAKIEQGMLSIIGDVRNYDFLKTSLLKHQPEIIFHLAAQPLVRHSYEFPIETYATNVMGTVHLLEAARHLSHCQAIINVTSDKCYENKEWFWGYREGDALGGHDPYSNSKACAELVSSAFSHSFYNKSNCGLATARAGNVIGGGDWAKNRLIPDIIKGIFNQQEIEIRNPDALRPWQHVLEPLHGYLLLAEAIYKNAELFRGPWNFGPEDQDVKPVKWIVDKLVQLTPKTTSWKLDKYSQVSHEAHHLKLDSSKAKSQLLWKPQWNLDTALEKTMDWYLAYEQQVNMQEKTLSQINNYASNLQDK